MMDSDVTAAYPSNVPTAPTLEALAARLDELALAMIVVMNLLERYGPLLELAEARMARKLRGWNRGNNGPTQTD